MSHIEIHTIFILSNGCRRRLDIVKSRILPMLKTISSCLWLPCCLVLLLLFSSCKTPKDSVYFQNLERDTLLPKNIARNFDQKIKPNDFLFISVASVSPEQSALYNAPLPAASSGTTAGGMVPGYQVDAKGNIQLFKLGEVKVAGLTRGELKDRLQKDLAPYLKDPVVTVRFLNQRITVLGEVARPQVLPLSNEQITVLEAIGQSGDLTAKARKDNILVIRQNENGKEFKRLNLLDQSLFASPYFYLQNEDVLYIEPDQTKKESNKGQMLSYLISGASLIFLVVDRFTK